MDDIIKDNKIYKENNELKKELKNNNKYSYLFRNVEKTNKKGHFDYYGYVKEMNETKMELKNVKNFLDICAAPGEYSKYFLEALSNSRGYAITLHPNLGGIEFDESLVDMKRYDIDYIDIMKDKYEPNVEFEFVIAGCLCMTLKKKPSFFDLDLWISTILIGLKNLKKGGTFAFKTTLRYLDLFCNFLFLMNKFFKKVKVFKSEDILGFRSVCYIIGIDYQGDKDMYNNLENLHKKYQQGEYEEINMFEKNLIFSEDFYPDCIKALEELMKIQNNAIKKVFQTGGDNNKFIRLLTYNVCWERMDNEFGPRSKLDGTKCLKKGRNVCRHNVVNYIKYITKKEKIDIICLQEETNINMDFKLKGFKYYLTIGDKEPMITYYRTSNLNIISKYETEFGANRPIQVIFFKNNKKNIIVLFNIHAGHDKFNDFTNFIKVIKKIKFNKIEKNYLKSKKIIICGDYNNQYPIKNGKLNNKIIFGNRRFYNQTKEPTCCYNFEERKPIQKIDHILTTSELSAYHINYINKHKYGYFSDHIPVLGIIG